MRPEPPSPFAVNTQRSVDSYDSGLSTQLERARGGGGRAAA